MNQNKKLIARDSLPLTKSLTNLISQVEQSTTEPVIFVFDNFSNNEGASAIIDEVPTVFLSSVGIRPITICHELLHLICETKGYSRPKAIKAEGQFTIPLIHQTCLEIAAMIEHQKIYHRMIELQYDPYKELEDKTLNSLIPNIQVHNPNNPYEIVDETNIAHHLQYFRNIMRPLSELGSLEIHQEIKKNAQIKCPKALEKAEAIAGLIKKEKNWDKKVCKRVLAKAIKIAGIPDGTYKIHP